MVVMAWRIPPRTYSPLRPRRLTKPMAVPLLSTASAIPVRQSGPRLLSAVARLLRRRAG